MDTQRQRQKDYEYANMILTESDNLGISRSLVEEYAIYYINDKGIEYKEAFRKALEQIKKERGIFNELK